MRSWSVGIPGSRSRLKDPVTDPSRFIGGKQEYFDLFDRGLLGNRVQSWESPYHALADGFKGNVTLRVKKVGVARSIAVIPVEEAIPVYVQWRHSGLGQEDIACNEAPDDGSRIFQGEVMRSEYYYDLWYSEMAAPMRIALATEPRHARGLTAVHLLKRNMDPGDYDWLQELFEMYPDCRVEFSCFQKVVGIHRTRTCFWEVRHY